MIRGHPDTIWVDGLSVLDTTSCLVTLWKVDADQESGLGSFK